MTEPLMAVDVVDDSGSATQSRSDDGTDFLQAIAQPNWSSTVTCHANHYIAHLYGGPTTKVQGV